MKVGAFSDSHGNLEYIENAAAYAVGKGGAETLIHLGDKYDDAKILNQFGKRLIRVPGVFSPRYQEQSVSNRIVETFGLWSVLISHAPEAHPNDLPTDLDPTELIRNHVIQIFLHGHTHEPRIEQSQGVWFVNPGHLRRQDKKGYPATFALLDLRATDATVQIFELVGFKEYMSRDFQLSQA